MKHTLTTFTAITLSAAILSVVLADGHGEHGIFKHVSTIEYDEIIPGSVSFATVAGDRVSGAHGTFVRIRAGKSTPLHIHGAAYHAVVIAGIFENPITDETDSLQQLPAGSYYYVPEGAPHISRCASTSPVDCITYFHQASAFDFTIVD